MSKILADEVIRTDPRFWGSKRAFCLNICLRYINETRDINSSRLNEIEKEIIGGSSGETANKLISALHDTLNRLNELGVSDSVLPLTKQKKPRPSILPKSSQEFIQSGTSSKMIEYFWSSWFVNNAEAGDEESLFAFGFALACICEGAIGKPVVQELICTLSHQNIENDLKVMVLF